MKNFILLALLAVSQVFGDIWLSKGMKEFGEVKTINFDLFFYLFTSPWIWLGVVFLVSSLFLYLTAISKLDLSYVLPIHASTYVLNALFAWVILGETIPTIRWVSTIIITIGVLLVGLSEGNSSGKSETSNFPLFLLSLNVSLAYHKTWLAVIILALADSAGDLLLAMGMKQVGEIEILPFKKLPRKLGKIINNYQIIGGVICQSIAFILFISVLSWADISFVRPATALTYVGSLLGAKYILKENVSFGRLVGIIFIGSGMLIHR